MNMISNSVVDRKKLFGISYEVALKNPSRLFMAAILCMVIFTAIFGPMIAPHDPLETNLSLRLASPSWQYPFGNDALGRCLFSRILCGARASIGLGFAIVMFSTLVGTIVGLISGYVGGLVDEFLMRIVDVFFSFPEIVAAMAVAGLMGPGTLNLLFALSVVSWMRYARLVRGISLSARERYYVKAARLSGVSGPAIMFRHLLPANIPSLIVVATIGLGKAVLGVSALGFLGFGVQPPSPEWGTLLMEGKDYILRAPHLSIYPGIAIMLSVLSFNLLGDTLRDTLAPD